jgi:hypothetical protein
MTGTPIPVTFRRRRFCREVESPATEVIATMVPEFLLLGLALLGLLALLVAALLIWGTQK